MIIYALGHLMTHILSYSIDNYFEDKLDIINKKVSCLDQIQHTYHSFKYY